MNIGNANEKFMCDTTARIYKPGEFWTKTKPVNFNPARHECCRSTICINGSILGVMDIDIADTTRHKQIFDYLAKRINESTVKPLFKFSGKKGFQVIWQFHFPGGGEQWVKYKVIQSYIYHLYRHWDLPTVGIIWGSSLDTNMFKNNSFVRGFCRRENGLYSIPILADDSWEDVQAKARLQKELVYNGIPHVYISCDDYTEFIRARNYQIKQKPKRIYIDVDRILQNPDASHTERYTAIIQLANNGLTLEQIEAKVHKENTWSDYNFYRTEYQIRYTYGWWGNREK